MATLLEMWQKLAMIAPPKNTPRPERCLQVAGAILLALLSQATLLAAEFGDVTDERLLGEAASGENWLRKSGNAAAQHFSPLVGINADNVDTLGVAWVNSLPIADGIAGTPVVVDGVIYAGAAWSKVFAIDAASGETLWAFDPEVRDGLSGEPTLSWLARANRGIAVGEGRVYASTADCRLLAIDAADAAKVWEQETCDVAQGYGISDSPYYGGGRVFVGNAGSESGEKNRGYVSAYDAETGEMLWRFFTVPSDVPAENDTPELKMAASTWSGSALAEYGGGGSNWNGMTYDPARGVLYFGTGGALPYEHHLRSPEGGDALFTSSILAVDAETGDYLWHYQTTPEDSWEYNATMNMVLADLAIGGETRETLLAAPKNGFQYVLDRETGELLNTGKYARVNWATHINPESGRPVLDPAADYWSHEPGTRVLVWPNMWGAHSWNPMAYSPDTGLLYIPVIDIPSEVTYRGDGDFDDTLTLVTEVDGEPFDPGKLVAYDPVRQRAVWTVAHELPFNGGVLATAGNLVFQGDAFGRFSAYRADNGEKLWSTPTGSTIGAAPATYAIDGTQYVLLPAGAGGGLQYAYPELHAVDRVQGPTRLIAFRLGGDQHIEMPTISRRPPPDAIRYEASAADLGRGEALFGEYCAGCHGKNGVGRYGGSVPDLRYATADVHDDWHAIVLGGSRNAAGMPAQDLDAGESEAVRVYVLSLAEQLREEL